MNRGIFIYELILNGLRFTGKKKNLSKIKFSGSSNKIIYYITMYIQVPDIDQ